jgi:MazG family protein
VSELSPARPSLLVVPLAPDEIPLLTLGELELLLARPRVVFEDDGHPLIERLQGLGAEVAVGEDPQAEDALVLHPNSSRLKELARAGAVVTGAGTTVPDSLTAAAAAPSARRAGNRLTGVVAVMARLRSEDGCPWDREQSHESLAVHLVEETYEVLEAIDERRLSEELEEELGDLLLQVVFHARLAEQAGRFDIASVAEGIEAKLLRRHPHVFGEAEASTAAQVLASWESLKAAEKSRSSPFDGIPRELPALLAAHKTQKRAAALGFEPTESEIDARVAQACSREGELGDALFWLAARARSKGIDAEGALRAATARFRSGF